MKNAMIWAAAIFGVTFLGMWSVYAFLVHALRNLGN